VLTGPARWVYRWEGAFHGHRVRQDVILDAGERYVDFLSRVYAVETNGFFALCLDLPVGGEVGAPGGVHADIPFGVEPRDLSGEPWSPDLPADFNNIERFRRNQLWARSWVSVSDGERGISVITADGDRYWTWVPERRELRHILLTGVRQELPPWDGWEAWVTQDRLALGRHEFRHRLLLHKGDWKSADICGESDRLRTGIQATKPLGAPVGRGLVPRPAGDQMTVTPGTVRLSAFYQEGDAFVVRVYESAGEETEAEIRLPFTVGKAGKVDFNLEKVEGTAEVRGEMVRLALRAWEIATVVVEAG
jgi:alpha-mannosidase